MKKELKGDSYICEACGAMHSFAWSRYTSPTGRSVVVCARCDYKFINGVDIFEGVTP